MDELLYKLTMNDDSTKYIKIWFSDNPPVVEENPGCIGISIYDSHMREIDGGELDYESSDTTLEDMIDSCIEFMDLAIIDKQLTKSLKLIGE